MLTRAVAEQPARVLGHLRPHLKGADKLILRDNQLIGRGCHMRLEAAEEYVVVYGAQAAVHGVVGR